MTSPINISVTIPGSFRSEYRFNDGSMVHQDRYVPGAAECVESRPASTSNRRSSSGWRSPSAWDHEITRYWNPVVTNRSFRTSSGTVAGTGDSDVFASYPVISFLPSLGDAANRAINKALLKLSNQQTDLGENFAEREQADRMIGDRIDKYTSQLTGRYISRHRRDWRRVKYVSPFVRHGLKYPNSWLEFQYGALPLLNDIYGAFQVIKDIDKDYDTFRVNVKATVSNDSETTTTSKVYPYELAYGDFNTLCDVRVVPYSGAFVRLDYMLVNPALFELQKLSLVNPALLAWNLLPYSFVVDWALPVGNYLQAWTADLGWQFLGGSISTMRKVEVVIDNIRVADDPGQNEASIEASSGHGFAMRFTRTVLHSSPAPRLPTFKNPLTLGHTANALSLLVTALAK